MSMKPVTLHNREAGPGKPVVIICEAGVTNYGELDLAKRQVDAFYESGADFIKFQVVPSTEALVSKRVALRLKGELGYDWFSRMKYKELSLEKAREIARYVATGGTPFFATAHEEEGLNFLDKEMSQPFFKVGTGEASNYEFLKNIGKRGKPVIISFGFQNDYEIQRAVATLQDAGARGVVVLHCVSLYPTPHERVNLSRIEHLRNLLDVPVGISDHSMGWHVPVAGVALGACVVEKHLTFGKNDPRSSDNAGALLPEEFRTMVGHIRDIEKALSKNSEDDRLSALSHARDWAGQSIVAARDLSAEETLSEEMLRFKRPGRGGIPPSALLSIVGKKIKKHVPEDEQIFWEDVGGIDGK